MKKKTAFLVLPLFVLFVYLGFKIAASIFQNRNLPSIQVAGVEPTTTPQQQNFLIVHVDDLSVKKPNLISSWSVFIYPANPPHLMVMPLTPQSEPEKQKDLNKSFKITTDKRLSNIYLSRIEQSYALDFDGYFVVDDTSSNLFTSWLTGDFPAAMETGMETAIHSNWSYDREASAWSQFCEINISGSAASYFNSINWNQVLPDHFSTNLSFDTITLAIDQIRHAATPPDCDVFSP